MRREPTHGKSSTARPKARTIRVSAKDGKSRRSQKSHSKTAEIPTPERTPEPFATSKNRRNRAFAEKPTLNRAWPKPRLRPPCAFEVSMIKVSCNSHSFTQLAAFFIDARAERSTVRSYSGFLFAKPTTSRASGSSRDKSGEEGKEEYSGRSSKGLFHASEASGLKNRHPTRLTRTRTTVRAKDRQIKKRDRLPLATRSRAGLGYKVFLPFSLRTAFGSFDALPDGPGTVEKDGDEALERAVDPARDGTEDTGMILPQVHLRKPCYDFYFL